MKHKISEMTNERVYYIQCPIERIILKEMISIVVKNNRGMLSRPVVRLDSGTRVDLLEHLDITIVKMLTDFN